MLRWSQIEAGMTLAFKVLEMSKTDYTPQISDFKFGRVTEVLKESEELTLEVEPESNVNLDGEEVRGRFHIDFEGQEESNLLSLKWHDLILPRIKL